MQLRSTPEAAGTEQRNPNSQKRKATQVLKTTGAQLQRPGPRMVSRGELVGRMEAKFGVCLE